MRLRRLWTRYLYVCLIIFNVRLYLVDANLHLQCLHIVFCELAKFLVVYYPGLS